MEGVEEIIMEMPQVIREVMVVQEEVILEKMGKIKETQLQVAMEEIKLMGEMEGVQVILTDMKDIMDTF